MKVLGLAGLYCSGKSSLVPLLEGLGFSVLDVDTLGHEALNACSQPVLEALGTLDRRALGKIVFADPQKLRVLESLLHPWMVQRVREILDHSPGVSWVINAALLFPMGLDSLCQRILWIEAPWWARLRRGLKRDGLGLLKTFQRMTSQKHLMPQSFSGTVDIRRVRNSGSLETLQKCVLEILDDFVPQRGTYGKA